jgi:mannose-6-phosphate isomerase-like protein (cupin superfamily)
MTSAFWVTLAENKRDPALAMRGDRKLLVTEVYADKEAAATEIYWRPGVPCPVQQMKDTESAIFTQAAKQTRHWHKIATEIYLLLEGVMTIEVEGSEYCLQPGDMMVVNPGARHNVCRDGEFLCRVITVNCCGVDDRFED